MYECKLETLSGSISMDQLLNNGVPASTAMFHRIQACGERRRSEGGIIEGICADCPARRVTNYVVNEELIAAAELL